MATAAEKEYKQAVRDAARASVVQGSQRQAAEVPRAGAAYPVRRLRSAGDLSRYQIGGFADDPLAPVPVKAPKPGGSKAATAARRSGQRKAAPKPVVRATIGRGVRTSGMVGAEEARYINRSVGVKPTGPSRA